MYILAGVAIQPPGVNLLHILAKLQYPPHAGSPVGTPLYSPTLCGPALTARSSTAACSITLGVLCKARAVGLECAQLHAVRAQLPRPAALTLTPALFACLQLPFQQCLLLGELILLQTLVWPGRQANKSR